MSTPISRGNFAKDLLPGVSEWFGTAYKNHDVKYSQIFEKAQSSRAFEEDVLASGLGVAQQMNEGAGVVYDTMTQGGTARYKHVTYANGFIITRNMLEDGQSELIAQQKSKALKWSMMHAKEIVAANILNRAFNSSYTGFDGKELCATDHATMAADVRNELTTAADLSEASIEQALIDIADFRDNRGLRIAVTPTKLVIPRELTFDAQRILKSELRPGTADNDLNAVKSMGLLQSGMVMNPYLTDADAWFIMTDIPEGLKYYDRRALEIDTDNDFDTKNAKFMATERYSFGWTDYRGIFGSPGA